MGQIKELMKNSEKTPEKMTPREIQEMSENIKEIFGETIITSIVDKEIVEKEIVEKEIVPSISPEEMEKKLQETCEKAKSQVRHEFEERFKKILRDIVSIKLKLNKFVIQSEKNQKDVVRIDAYNYDIE